MSYNTILATAPLTTQNYHLKMIGTSIGNSLIWDNGTNVGIGNTNTSYTLDVSGTGRFTGNLGVGSGTLNAYTGYSVLTINNSTTGSVLDLNRSGVRTGTFYADTSGVGIGALTATNLDIFTGNSYIDFQTNGAERMRITSAGLVGIGTTSPDWPLTIASSTTTAALKILGRTDGGSAIVFSNQANTTNFSQIDAGAAYLFISTLTASPIAFYTNNTERMRITSIASGGYTKISNYGGYINVNGNYHEIVTSRNNENVAYITNTAASPYGPFLYFLNAAPNNTTNYFLQCSDSSVVCFTIWSNGTTSGRSDIRLKKNIADATPKLNSLMKLRIVNYEWKESIEGGKELGLIAQEVEEIFPNLVITQPIKKKRNIQQEDGTFIEEEYEDGDLKSIKNSVLPYITIKALQELTTLVQEQQAQIEELSNRLIKLESK
jgi:effector-binding domain-containing protein